MNMSERVAIFIPSLNGGGAEKAMLILGEGIVELGFDVDLITASKGGVLSTDIHPKIRWINFGKNRTFSALLPLTSYLRKEKPAVLFSTISHANIIAVLSSILARSRTNVIIRESNSPLAEIKKSLPHRIVHALVPHIYPLAHGVIAVSEGVANQLKRMERSKNPFKMAVLPNPVITSRFFSDAEKSVDHPWLISKDKPVIIGCGRLVSAKGFDVLLHAFQLVRREIDARLILIGEGELREELSSVAEQLGIKKHVSMPGFVKNPFPYFRNADVFVLSSRFEGMPNVLLQAMSLGRPVVATDCESGPRECLQNGEYGFLIPVENVIGMAKAIIHQIKNPIRSEEAALHMQKKYSAKAAAGAYLNFAGIGGQTLADEDSSLEACHII